MGINHDIFYTAEEIDLECRMIANTFTLNNLLPRELQSRESVVGRKSHKTMDVDDARCWWFSNSDFFHYFPLLQLIRTRYYAKAFFCVRFVPSLFSVLLIVSSSFARFLFTLLASCRCEIKLQKHTYREREIFCLKNEKRVCFIFCYILLSIPSLECNAMQCVPQ